MLGYSLSFCIKDILGGTVAEGDVEKIITSTACRTEADWEAVFATYRQHYWNAFDASAAIELVQRLRAQGKIEQPRLDNPDHWHPISDGWWK